jgi:hypothetical protein
MKTEQTKIFLVRLSVTLLVIVAALAALNFSGPAASEAKTRYQSCGGYIWYGQQVSGSIPWKGADCRYTFSASYGDIVTIKMYRNRSYLVPALTLLDSYGNQIAIDNNYYRYSSSSINGYRLSRGGTYTIVAKSYNYGSSGGFSLSLSKR